MSEVPYHALDPGIVGVVRRLNEFGYETTDSGDGVSKPDVGRVFDFPHVAVRPPWSGPTPSYGSGAALDDRWVETRPMADFAEQLKRVLGDGWEVELSYSTRDKQWVAMVMAEVASAREHTRTD